MIVRITREALMLVLVVSTPPLIAALGVGILVGLLQAMTQLQEQTLSYVPKILAVFLVLMAVFPWILRQLVRFTVSILLSLAQVGC